MIQVSGACERNIKTDGAFVYNVGSGQTLLVLPADDFTVGEISARLIQNCGANPCYYSENMMDNGGILNNPNSIPICDGTINFHGLLQAGQQLDCSSHRQCVAVYSPLGTVISTTIRRRQT